MTDLFDPAPGDVLPDGELPKGGACGDDEAADVLPETAPDSPNLFEGMTAISAILDPAITSFNDRRILSVFVDRTRTQKKARELAFLKRKSRELGFSIQEVRPDDLNALTSGTTHGGIAAVCSPRTIPSLKESMASIRPDGFYVLLDGIEDPYNFAYTLRSLYAAGADGIILPPRNWMSEDGLVARSSAGTSEKLPLFVSDPAEAAEVFHSLGYRVACAGIRDSVELYDADLSRPLLLVIGGEKRGISRAVLSQADMVVRIGYKGDFRGSLPSAASAAVLAFEVMRQNNGK